MSRIGNVVKTDEHVNNPHVLQMCLLLKKLMLNLPGIARFFSALKTACSCLPMFLEKKERKKPTNKQKNNDITDHFTFIEKSFVKIPS